MTDKKQHDEDPDEETAGDAVPIDEDELEDPDEGSEEEIRGKT